MLDKDFIKGNMKSGTAVFGFMKLLDGLGFIATTIGTVIVGFVMSFLIALYGLIKHSIRKKQGKAFRKYKFGRAMYEAANPSAKNPLDAYDFDPEVVDAWAKQYYASLSPRDKASYDQDVKDEFNRRKQARNA